MPMVEFHLPDAAAPSGYVVLARGALRSIPAVGQRVTFTLGDDAAIYAVTHVNHAVRVLPPSWGNGPYIVDAGSDSVGIIVEAISLNGGEQEAA